MLVQQYNTIVLELKGFENSYTLSLVSKFVNTPMAGPSIVLGQVHLFFLWTLLIQYRVRSWNESENVDCHKKQTFAVLET
jgi:hypothetical protein